MFKIIIHQKEVKRLRRLQLIRKNRKGRRKISLPDFFHALRSVAIPAIKVQKDQIFLSLELVRKRKSIGLFLPMLAHGGQIKWIFLTARWGQRALNFYFLEFFIRGQLFN